MKNKKNIEKVKRDAENLAESTKEAFVDYVNDITDRAQKFTAEKLEELEEKTVKAINGTKASAKSQARSINNMTDKPRSEFQSTTDTILFQ